ncbi:MAG: Biotin transporter BioY [Eubacteriales bacterium SKADARSKE-1]|nr:Biotin transporter BioY [Eubacteriales bacterium SKADARSKE-1]
MTKYNVSHKIINFSLVSLFTALMAISAIFLKIPLPSPFPPISTQFFVCCLCAIVTGPKLSSLSMFIYLILGLLGLPVFTMGGGIYYIFSPTFGYILAFIGCAFITGSFSQQSQKKYSCPKAIHLFLGCFLSLMFLYLCGTCYLYIIKNIYMHSNINILFAIKVGILPFILQDSVWCFIASVIGPHLYRSIQLIYKN